MAMSECNEFLSFVNKTFDAWAWPLTVLAIVWPLRHSLEKLIGRVKSLEGGGVKAEFDAGLTAASVVASTIPPSQPTIAPVMPSSADDVAAMAANPTGVVMEAWKSLEQAARLLLATTDPEYATKGVLSGRYVPFVSAFLSSPTIDEEERRLFKELQRLRNLVAHTPNPKLSKSEVERYVDLCEKLSAIFGARAKFMSAAQEDMKAEG